MPRWNVHELLGETCGIPRRVMREVNKFIDLGLNHDKGRFIVYGHWDPRELYSIATQVHTIWGTNGVRAMIHHHLMDYTCTLITKLKGGVLVRHVLEDIRRTGFATIYEDIDTGRVYSTPLPYSRSPIRLLYLKKEDMPKFIFERIITQNLTKYLVLSTRTSTVNQIVCQSN